MLERTISKSIISYFDDFKVILASGARQVGKTTLLKSLMENNRNYVTLDNRRDREIAQNDQDAFFILHPVPCMIDEVQRAPELFLKIKEIVDDTDKKNLIWITGSQKPRLMKNVGDTLSGRVVEIRMYPLSQAEKQKDPFRQSFYPSFSKEEPAPWSYMETIENIVLGGYPALLSIKPENRSAWFRSYIGTYILGDIRDEGEEIDDVTFLKMLRILAARTAESLNYSTIANETGISTYKAKKMINLLISYGIIHLLEPYSKNTLKSIVKTQRLHFTDSGLCCHLLGIHGVEEFIQHPLAGHVFESYVVGEIIKNARNNGDDAAFYFYREEGKKKKIDNQSVAEIDLIKESGNKVYPIEIKMSASPSIHMARHFEKLESDMMGTIVCLSSKKTILSKNLLVMPISMI